MHRISMKWISTLTLFFHLFVSTNVHANWVETLRPIESVKLTILPEDGVNEVLSLLNKSKSSVKMMMYHLSNKKVVQKLKDLAGKGIKVQIIIDFDSLTYNCYYQKLAKELTQSGAEVFWSSDAFSLMHIKSFLVDDKHLWLSTLNLTQAVYYMRDFSITTQDALLISEFKSLFETDIKNAQTKGSETPETKDPNVVVSPTNSQQKLVELINSAKTTIDLYVENMGHPEIQKALLHALERKVAVRLITPDCVFLNIPEKNDPSLKELVAAGAQSRLMQAPESKDRPYLHAKVINVDYERVFLGSENFSKNSINYSREMGVILPNTKVAKQIQAAFNVDWNRTVDFSTLAPGRCPLPPPPSGDGKPPVCEN